MDNSKASYDGKLVVVAGGGHFGSKAVKFAKKSGARVAVVDIDPHCTAAEYVDMTQEVQKDEVPNVEKGSAVLYIQNAVGFLLNLLPRIAPDYIVPALPGHLVGWVVEGWLKSNGFCVTPAVRAVSKVASSMPAGTVIYTNEAAGVIVTSYMPQGLLCRVPCMQPGDRCPTTGRVKAGPMHQILFSAAKGNTDLSRILVSRLIGPEVGCFRGEELAHLLKDLGRISTPHTIGVGTSCECHGILNLFYVSQP